MIYRLIKVVIKHYIIGRRLGENAKLSAAHAVDTVQDNTVGILAWQVMNNFLCHWLLHYEIFVNLKHTALYI